MRQYYFDHDELSNLGFNIYLCTILSCFFFFLIIFFTNITYIKRTKPKRVISFRSISFVYLICMLFLSTEYRKAYPRSKKHGPVFVWSLLVASLHFNESDGIVWCLVLVVAFSRWRGPERKVISLPTVIKQQDQVTNG